MNLRRVTITGADDTTSIDQMTELSGEFPFVEWGILMSRSQEGGPRFPSRDWIIRLAAVAMRLDIKLSAHLCGSWVRDLLVGKLDWGELPPALSACRRVQINTHAQPHVSTLGMIKQLSVATNKEFIFQFDDVNNHLAYAAHAYGITVSALFDASHGAGQLPGKWLSPAESFTCGYAGGLGPDNVIAQVANIEDACPKPYWIDMERNVRTPDDLNLDMLAVRKVLEQCAAVMAFEVGGLVPSPQEHPVL